MARQHYRVSDKTNLVPFAKALADQNVKLIASGAPRRD